MKNNERKKIMKSLQFLSLTTLVKALKMDANIPSKKTFLTKNLSKLVLVL